MKSTDIGAHTCCPKCEAIVNRASDPTGENTPSPEDFTVCIYCGAVLIFTEDMTLRSAMRGDFEKLPPELALKLGAYVGAVHLRLRKQNNGNH